jgi:hypothetical protein
MSRKPKKGYFVRGQFVAEGSELDLELKAELKGTTEASRTDLKRESTELQKLGEALLTLRADLMERLALPEKLTDAWPRPGASPTSRASAARCSTSASSCASWTKTRWTPCAPRWTSSTAARPPTTLALHQAEQWRDRLIADDDAIGRMAHAVSRHRRSSCARWPARPARTPSPTKRPSRKAWRRAGAAPTARSSSWCASRWRPAMNELDPVRIGIVSISDRAVHRRL